MDIQAALQRLIERGDLLREEMRSVMHQVMQGAATPAQIGAFLAALRMKGETVDEITAAAEVMRELVSPVDLSGPNLIDTCGTGGDASGTFNISTAAAFVVAAAGGKVAKHGNRSVSSRSGSADLLEAAGVNLTLTAQQVAQCVDQIGVGFMFAPHHHPAMKHAGGPRREMGIRTLFNLLGPLANPAGAPNQLIGVFSAEWVEPLAEVLRQLGAGHVLVVHAEDGLDEISIGAATMVAELQAGDVNCYQLTPEQFGFQRMPLTSIKAANVEESLAIVQSVLDNQPGPARDIVALNAGAAIYAAELAKTIEQGVQLALSVIASGAARNKFDRLIELTQTMTKDD